MTEIVSASRLGIVAFAVALGIAAQAAVAADAVGDDRSVPGSVVPSTGTTAGAKADDSASADGATDRASRASSSGGGAACRAARQRYAQSQACFGRYRLVNGGLKPEAFEHCEQLENPAIKCGSAVVE